MTFAHWLKTEQAQALVDACATDQDLRAAWKQHNLSQPPETVFLHEWRHWSEWR